MLIKVQIAQIPSIISEKTFFKQKIVFYSPFLFRFWVGSASQSCPVLLFNPFTPIRRPGACRSDPPAKWNQHLLQDRYLVVILFQPFLSLTRYFETLLSLPHLDQSMGPGVRRSSRNPSASRQSLTRQVIALKITKDVACRCSCMKEWLFLCRVWDLVHEDPRLHVPIRVLSTIKHTWLTVSICLLSFWHR